MTNSFEDLFSAVTGCLEAATVSYMFTGSFASGYHGTPRAADDLDILVDLDLNSLDRLLEQLETYSAFYVNRAAAEEAVESCGQFTLSDPASGWTVDFAVMQSHEFSRQQFERRQPVTLFGRRVFVASAEDTILSKLERTKVDPSEQQLWDVHEILAGQADGLDKGYLEFWIETLGLVEEFAKAQRPLP